MVSTIFQLFLSLVLLLIITTQAVDDDGRLYYQNFDCHEEDLRNKSTYLKNVNRSLSSLISSNNSNGYGFYKSSYGENAGKVYTIGLCRGDLNPDVCVTCLNHSMYALLEGCPSDSTEAGLSSGNCKIRYSNHSMHGKLELLPSSTSSNTKNVSSSSLVVEGFNQRLMALLEVLKVEAAGGGSLLKFAVGNASVAIYPHNISTVYGLEQCSPDLSELNCLNCLDEAFRSIQKYSYGRGFGRHVNPSCTLWYAVDYLFFDPAAKQVPVALPPLPPPLSTARGMMKGNKFQTVIVYLVTIVLSVIFNYVLI